MMRIGVAVLVAIVAVAIVVGGFWLIRRRLVIDTTAPESRARTVGRRLFVAVVGLWLLALVLSFAIVPDSVQARLRVSHIGLALLLYLALLLAVLEIPRWILRRTWATSPASPPTETAVDPSALDGADAAPGADVVDAGAVVPEVDVRRRLLISRAIAGGAGATAFGLTGFGYLQANRRIPPKQVAIQLDRLAAEHDGLRIALLADVHIHAGVRERGFMQEVVDTVNGQDVDLAVIVGDLIDGTVDELRDAVEPLQDVQARIGRYYATGNHEYFYGADQWVEHLPKLGWEVLLNRRTEITHRGATFDLVGLDDLQGGSHGRGPDWAAAFDGRDEDRPAILLAHQPVLAQDAADRGVDLMLAGHTHGGQLWPLEYLIKLQQRHAAGLSSVGDRTRLYVTRGVGTSGPSVRVAAPPEVTIITLRAPH